MKTSQKIGLLTGLIFSTLILVFQPFELLSATGHSTLAVGGLMAFWWMSEAIPIPVTAMIPIVFFPLLNIESIKVTTKSYGHPIIYLFLGGFLLAMAIEKWNLHRRLALNILKVTTDSPSQMIGGFMIVSAGLSMWVTNTATTMMLLPVAVSIFDLMKRNNQLPEKELQKFTFALLLAIAYAASIGGMATIIGTAPNSILASFLAERSEIEVSFLGWMKIGIPLVIVLLPITWLLITKGVYNLGDTRIQGGKSYIHGLLEELGPMSRDEKAVGIVFILTALAWIFRSALNTYIFTHPISDTGIAIAAGIILFVLPSSKPNQNLLSWEDTARLPWSLLLMFGGGLALAGAFETSGVSAWIGTLISGSDWAHPLLVVAVVTALTTFVTELTSNTATTATFLPIMFPIAASLGMSAPLLLLPATFAASCAFMLPVATPPNGIVFGSGRVSIHEMMRAGFWLNIFAIGIISLMSYWLVPELY